MEFTEQTYLFLRQDTDNDEESVKLYSSEECKIVISALQSVLTLLGGSAGTQLAKRLRNKLNNDAVSFLDCIERMWASLRSENGITLHLPVSLLDLLTKSTLGSQQGAFENEEMDLRFSFELDGSGGIFLKRRDGSARVSLQRTISDVDKEEEWLPYVLTSVNRIFNENKEKLMSNTAIAWSPGLTKYECLATTDSRQSQKSSYTLTYSKAPQTYPVVVYTKRGWTPVSERTIYGLPQAETRKLIRQLVSLLNSYQSNMETRPNGQFLAEKFAKCGKKTMPLPGFRWPLAVAFLPCLADFHSLKHVTQHALKGDTDEYRISPNMSEIQVLQDYETLKAKLKSLARKCGNNLESAASPTHTEPAQAKLAKADKQMVEKHPEQAEEHAVSIKESPSIAQIEEPRMPARKVALDKLSQLKAVSMAHTILDHSAQHAPQSSSAVREKVVTAVKEQVQMESAVRSVYDPPDRTAELATLVSGIRQGGGSRMRIIEQLIPSIRSIMDARRGYLHQKLKAGPAQHAALQLWDAFHNDVMPPNIFAELLLNIESDLELYTFYGIFRDIVYGMYLGMDTRGHLQLLCTSVQSYFSYELYAESTENMKKRVSINTLLVNTSENCDESRVPDTWINHYQTLLREIFGLLKEGTQAQIKQVIRFEDEFLDTVGPM
ncbi:hypothetical protein GL50803_0016681 [Giardia duodenalis]|uniref:Uncharacterized protein n=1 Tax=Giardia intestinalis (strain ATCC 50803 / WB clone C6) TaxID=184922 RepID=A8BX53_GIAIC|nr:hypothetical protein GL50803_0016681 [Giardia intestinalis]KAE8303254.1 hypothetical protein GL50803_0016681 [Giardia intestinalis]|eukprot:XP_001704370.1 Hypothetical protein GL50803_16681 [Giardia lamblia ATCC 50803]